jgi:(p)ppGpp synthase/HD superfamily hydrolase
MKGEIKITNFEYCKQIARVAHFGQFRKFTTPEEPYIHHPLRVASKFTDEKLKCIAVLHDVLEDSNFTADMLSVLGVDSEITKVVEILTHIKPVLYTDYIKTIKANPDAVQVKIQDITDNMRTAPASMVEKRYLPALEYLRGE